MTQPMTKARLRPRIAPIEPPVIMKAAMTRVYSVIAVWMPVTVVPRSLATVAIDTFITDESRIMTNCAAASVTSTAFAAAPAAPSVPAVVELAMCSPLPAWWNTRADGRRYDHCGGESPPRPAPLHGHVRARRRHVDHERVDQRGGARPPHRREHGAERDRARGTGLRRLHPDRQQGRRPDRPQARVRARPPRLRDRRDRDDVGAERRGRHRLLGAGRWTRRVTAPSCDAVA